MEDGVFPIVRDVVGIRILPVSHHKVDFSSEVLLIEAKSLLAVAAVVEKVLNFIVRGPFGSARRKHGH
jgi:hypothetical protein